GGATIMKEILTIAGVTPDEEFGSFPGAVREWCINTGVVDPATDSVLVNSEDGRLYRWNLGSNTLTEVVTISAGLGEAYTPTLIGPGGIVYAINNATLFAVGAGIERSWLSGAGSFAAGTNWSAGNLPPGAFDSAVFDRHSSLPYTVT